MTDRIVSSLTEGKKSVKETFRSWREKYLQNTDQGTLDAMQICVDVSGYGYVFQPDDLENVGNSREFVREKIIKTGKDSELNKKIRYVYNKVGRLPGTGS